MLRVWNLLLNSSVRKKKNKNKNEETKSYISQVWWYRTVRLSLGHTTSSRPAWTMCYKRKTRHGGAHLGSQP